MQCGSKTHLYAGYKGVLCHLVIQFVTLYAGMFSSVFLFLFATIITFQTSHINVEKELFVFLVLEAASVRQKGAFALIKHGAKGFHQIHHHTENHTNTVTLQVFPLFQLSLI